MAGLTAVSAAVVVPSQGIQLSAARDTCPTQRGLQMVEANIKAGMTLAQTKADLAKVYKDRPDFVAMNEVSGRDDSLLAPEGYGIWRTPGRYTGANPVTWRSDRWNVIAQGTIYVSNLAGKDAGQTSEWGIRYANWITARSVDGCQTVSVVAYHVAPKGDRTSVLLKPSVDKIGTLVRQLATDGPVLAAGDLNRHYRGSLYPREQLASYEMVPTWQLTGKVLPTGDHNGATIDFIFLRNAAQFRVTRQVTRELYSDHDAVVADLSIDRGVVVQRPPVSFVRGHVLNVPASPVSAGRRAVITRVLNAIRLAPAGSTVLVATGRLDGAGLRDALLAAFRRGVAVRVVSWSQQRTWQEKILMRELGEDRTRRSFAIRRPYSTAAALPPTALVFSSSAGSSMLGFQIDQTLDAHLVTQPVRAQITREEADFLRLRDGIRKQFR